MTVCLDYATLALIHMWGAVLASLGGIALSAFGAIAVIAGIRCDRGERTPPLLCGGVLLSVGAGCLAAVYLLW
jgi:hypothetical protein